MDSKPRYPEIKLANEDLTGATKIYTSKYEYWMPRFDLAPRSQRQVAIAARTELTLLTYEPSSTGVRVVDIRQLYSGPEHVHEVAFSHDGTKIAYLIGVETVRIEVFDLTATADAVTNLGTVQWAKDMAWFADGSAIVYVDDGSPNTVREIRLDGTAQVLFSEANIESVDVSRTPGDRTIVVGYSRPNEPGIYLGLWDGSYINERLASGYEGHFKCDDSRIVFRGNQRTNQPTYFYNFDTATTSLLTKNADVRRVDYVPTCN